MLISPIVVFKSNRYPTTNQARSSKECKQPQKGVDTVCFGNKPQYIKNVGKNLPAYQKSLEELLASRHVQSALTDLSKQNKLSKDILLERFKSGEISTVRNVLLQTCLTEAVETDKRISIKKLKDAPVDRRTYIPYIFRLGALKGLSFQEIAKMRLNCPAGKSVLDMIRELPELPEESTRDEYGVPMVYENILEYLERVDENIVTKPYDLEKLKQCKVTILGEKARILAKANAEETFQVREVLKEQIQEILLGKAGKDGEIVTGCSDEKVLEGLAKYVEEHGNWCFLAEESDPILYMGLIDIIKNCELPEESEKVAIYNLVNMKKRLGVNFSLMGGWAFAKAFYSSFLKYFTPEQAREFLKFQEEPEIDMTKVAISSDSAISILNKYLSDDCKVCCDSTPGELKSAYRNLMLKYHPDINPTNNAQEIFTEITQAYNKLKGDS